MKSDITDIMLNMRILTRRSVALVFLLISVIAAVGQDKLDRQDTRALVAMISERQQPWEKLELSGKLKMEGLPVSPSVKIYMERSVRIDISIRAPFVGEVGRLQADADSILVVNKMKKNYWKASMEEISEKYPGGIEMIQSLLLGRIYVFGEGVIDAGMASIFDIYADEEDGWLLMPKNKYQVPGARYGYVVSEEGDAESLVVERDESEDFLQLDYIGKKKGKYDIDLMLVMGRRNIDARLSFDSPKEDAVPMAPINVGSGYTRLQIKEFIGKFF